MIKSTKYLLAAGTLATGLSLSADTKKPNIIYILADDAGIGDFGCYGGKHIKTPHIDKMAEEGMRFTNHYSGAASCAPSRSTLMTGMHLGHCYVRSNGGTAIRDQEVTVAEILKNEGYSTGCVGKWSLGDPGTSGVPTKQGFDMFCGYLDQRRAHRYYPNYIWKNDKKVELKNNSKERHTYIHDMFVNESKQFIKDNKEKPFFLYMALTLPHADLDVPEEYIKPYIGKLGPEKAYPKGYFNAQPTPKAAFAGMISLMDKDVGGILDLLKELKLDKNTIVMFSSDNGVHSEAGFHPEALNSNGDYRGYKRDIYDGGIHSPHIAWFPGKIKAGSVSNHISAFWDFLPTAVELAGAEVPKNTDGISYLPELTGKVQKKHEYLYWHILEHGVCRAIRAGDWKLVQTKIKKNPDAPFELYNLKNDKSESKNLADQYPEKVAELKQFMTQAYTAPEKTKRHKKNKKSKKH